MVQKSTKKSKVNAQRRRNQRKNTKKPTNTTTVPQDTDIQDIVSLNNNNTNTAKVSVEQPKTARKTFQRSTNESVEEVKQATNALKKQEKEKRRQELRVALRSKIDSKRNLRQGNHAVGDGLDMGALLNPDATDSTGSNTSSTQDWETTLPARTPNEEKLHQKRMRRRQRKIQERLGKGDTNALFDMFKQQFEKKDAQESFTPEASDAIQKAIKSGNWDALEDYMGELQKQVDEEEGMENNTSREIPLVQNVFDEEEKETQETVDTPTFEKPTTDQIYKQWVKDTSLSSVPSTTPSLPRSSIVSSDTTQHTIPNVYS